MSADCSPQSTRRHQIQFSKYAPSLYRAYLDNISLLLFLHTDLDLNTLQQAALILPKPADDLNLLVGKLTVAQRKTGW